MTTVFNSIDDCFNFGRFEGRSLAEVLYYNPDYFFWCLDNVDGCECVFSKQVLLEIEEIFPNIVTKMIIDKVEDRIKEYKAYRNVKEVNDHKLFLA